MTLPSDNKLLNFRQRDIGLERYDAKQLFLHLVTPTAIVIITVIQLHYCHSKFLEISEIPEGPIDDISKASSVAYGTFSARSDDEADETEDNTDFINDIKIRKLSKHEITGAVKRIFSKLLTWAEIVLLFVEIHAYKIMLVGVFLLAIKGVELIHFGFVILGVAGLKANTETQFLITRIASLVSSIILISEWNFKLF